MHGPQPWTYKGVQSPIVVPDGTAGVTKVKEFATHVGMMLPLLTVGQCDALIASINTILSQHGSNTFYILTGVKWVVRGMSLNDDEEAL